MEEKTDSQQIQRIFWDTQPVPKLGDYDGGKTYESKPINNENIPANQQPIKLLDQFEWDELDINNIDQLKDIYVLLNENYVEDDDAMFRFDYSIDFLKWALCPPGYYPDWLVVVKVKKSKKIIGFITAIPLHMNVEGQQVKMAEVLYKIYQVRKHRLAPVLIKEITRRVNCKNIWQAVYTAGIIIPTPFSQAQYYHRSLNPKKLIDIGFSRLQKQQTISRLVKLYKLPESPQTENIRPMKPKDVSQVQKLLSKNQQNLKLYNTWNLEEVKYWFLTRKDVIYSYVVENNKQITDFVSFYCLPSSILNHEKHKELKAAYSYYNVSTVTPLEQLVQDSMIFAIQEGFDVYNALDIMDNPKFINELKFQPGDGYLNYYLYNWQVSKKMDVKDLGMVLV